MDPASTLSLIRKLEARDLLTEEERSAIRGMMSDVRVVNAREDIVSDGDRPRQSTLLIEGFAARAKFMRDGSRQLTALHVQGDFVDLHSFLLKEMDHGIVALSTCRIATVPHDTLLKFSEQMPHLTRLFWLLTLLDGAIHREAVVRMGRKNALAQIVGFLCETYLRLEVVGAASDRTFRLPLTQATVGDLLGLSSVHVNRLLQDLRRQNWLSWEGSVVTLLDWDALTEAAEFDPRYLHLVQEPR